MNNEQCLRIIKHLYYNGVNNTSGIWIANCKKKITTAISSIDVLMYYYFCLVVVGGWWFWWLVVQDQKQKLCAICMLNGLLPFSSSKDIFDKIPMFKKKVCWHHSFLPISLYSASINTLSPQIASNLFYLLHNTYH